MKLIRHLSFDVREMADLLCWISIIEQVDDVEQPFSPRYGVIYVRKFGVGRNHTKSSKEYGRKSLNRKTNVVL